MRTLEEIKKELLAENHSRIATINNLEIELSEAEFIESINKKAEMVFVQEKEAAEKEAIKQAKISAYTKLGLTADEIAALLDDNKSNSQ
jgi:hypothetical protein